MIKSLMFIFLASALVTGNGAPQVASKSLEIPKEEIVSTRMEALAGSGIAAFRLYNYYDIVQLNREESFYWATISAENGHPSGMYSLGFRLSEKKDAESRSRARYWLHRAEQNGVSLASGVLKQLDESR